MSDDVKIYTVNGAPAGSSVALPDWLVRARAVKGKGAKRATKERVESNLELIQGFEFPEASLRVKSTRDGGHIVATGTYKPQMRVWDVGQLSLKFERHSDAENVDFTILSDDWTKVLMLQNDRSIEVHAQGGLHHRTRIPRFGRALAYHFPSCTALLGAAGSEVYRLALDQGRFLAPLQLGAGVDGVNALDVNPAHGLWACGTSGAGAVHFVDPRSRAGVGVLPLPGAHADAEVSSLASRSDGLSYAVGTSAGHTLLFDVRARRPFAVKDQGYGLPVRRVSWIEGGARLAGDGLVLSADRKVVKIWDRNSPGTNFAALTPADDLNDVHHVPGSGLLLSAHEGMRMGAFFIPQLGPAPRWAGFLEHMTEELEDGGAAARGVYADYKFVSRGELAQLGMEHLVGTPALKPYMHGFFVALELYDTARVIANPYVYEEARAAAVQRKLDASAEARIRAPKNAPKAQVKVNKALAEKVARDAEKAREKEARRRARRGAADADAGEDAMAVDGAAETLLTDARFGALFADPEFEVDARSREYALLNPSAAAAQRGRKAPAELREDFSESGSGEEDSDGSAGEGADDVDVDVRATGKTRTAVEEEEDESDKAHSDSDDSSDAGELYPTEYKARQRGQPMERVKYAPLRASGSASTADARDAPFGQRRALSAGKKKAAAADAGDQHVVRNADGSVEMSWVPSAGAGRRERGERRGKSADGGRKGVERFGAGMEKGGEEPGEGGKGGRTSRRRDVRSGSKNTFRKM